VMGVAFLLFLPFAGGGANSTPLLAIVGILLVFTIAELLISPVGLSVSTKLAPELFKTQMVALFFLSVALGSAVSGQLAKWYDVVPETVYFGVLGGIAILLGVLLAVFARPVLRLMSGVR
jgi:proton-dependent oligopeptide transporter, POT family